MNKDDLNSILDNVKVKEPNDLPEIRRETIKTGFPTLDDILYTVTKTSEKIKGLDIGSLTLVKIRESLSNIGFLQTISLKIADSNSIVVSWVTCSDFKAILKHIDQKPKNSVLVFECYFSFVSYSNHLEATKDLESIRLLARVKNITIVIILTKCNLLDFRLPINIAQQADCVMEINLLELSGNLKNGSGLEKYDMLEINLTKFRPNNSRQRTIYTLLDNL